MRIYNSLLSAAKFRKVFAFGEREVAHWFPGHMAKGLKQMRASLRKVDYIIEIHDARISFFFVLNPSFQESLDVRPHILVLNKMDLADTSKKQSILKQLEREGVRNILFTDCLRQRDENIVPLVTELIESGSRFHREEDRSYCLMVIGVPNVGKSSLINAIRRTYLKKGKASKVGGEPGSTKAVLTKIQACETPLLDTPGVLPPRLDRNETCTILDHLVGEDVIADYLLFSLNRLERFNYIEKYNLEEPCDDIQHVLKSIAVNLGKTKRVKAITGVAISIKTNLPTIRAFRKGELGKVMLD
uniref:Mitochondrial GTPase 1 n=1 Tax=Sinocyclocheilus grahami TaxID=75366 RepID=A0A672T6C6_SINGR